MTEDTRPDLPVVPSAVAIRSYMRNSGWRESTQGTVGSVWTKGDAKFCVPHEGDDPDLIQRALVRLASAEGRTAEETTAAIAEYRDARAGRLVMPADEFAAVETVAEAYGSTITAGALEVTSPAPAPGERPGTATGRPCACSHDGWYDPRCACCNSGPLAPADWRGRAERAEAKLSAVAEYVRSRPSWITDPVESRLGKDAILAIIGTEEEADHA